MEFLNRRYETILEFALGKMFEFQGQMYVLYDLTTIDNSTLSLGLECLPCLWQGNREFCSQMNLGFKQASSDDLKRIVQEEVVEDLFTSTGKEEGPVLAGTDDRDGTQALKMARAIQDVVSIPVETKWFTEDFQTTKLGDLELLVNELKNEFRRPVWILLRVTY